MTNRYFIDRTQPTVIAEEAPGIQFTVRTAPVWAARDVYFDKEVAKQIFELQQNSVLLQQYLHKMYNTTQYMIDKGEGPELPAFLQEKPRGKRKVQAEQKASK